MTKYINYRRFGGYKRIGYVNTDRRQPQAVTILPESVYCAYTLKTEIRTAIREKSNRCIAVKQLHADARLPERLEAPSYPKRRIVRRRYRKALRNRLRAQYQAYTRRICNA